LPTVVAMSAGFWVLIGLTLVGSGIVLWVVAERTADGRVDLNRYAGIRTRTTLNSEEAWVAGHRAAKRGTQVAATLIGLTGIGLVANARNPDLAKVLIIVGSALWCGALIKATIASTRAAKAASSASGPAGTA